MSNKTICTGVPNNICGAMFDMLYSHMLWPRSTKSGTKCISKVKLNISISSGQIVKSEQEERFTLPFLLTYPFFPSCPLSSLPLEVGPLNPARGWGSAVSSPSTADNNFNNFPENQKLTKFRAFCQRCCPRDKGLGLEVPRGQKWKSWSWIMKSWSWSWTFGLCLGLSLQEKVLRFFKTVVGNSWRQWQGTSWRFVRDNKTVSHSDAFWQNLINVSWEGI